MAPSVVAVLLAAAAAPPVPVSVDGLGGVAPGMTVAQVRARWHTPLPVRVVSPGSDAQAYATVRLGPLRARLRFWGGAAGPWRLQEAVATAGVRSDRGIAVGDPRSAVLAAYGASARRRGRSADLIVLGPRRARPPGVARSRVALVFRVVRGRVAAIAVGWRDAV